MRQVYLCCILPPANDYKSHLQHATTAELQINFITLLTKNY